MALLLALVGCGGEAGGSATGDGSGEGGAGGDAPGSGGGGSGAGGAAEGGGGAAPVDPSAELFDDTVLHDVYLEVEPAAWQYLKDNFDKDIWTPANFEWKGERAENIGIRSRGLGSRSPIKPGLKVDFDRYVAGQKFRDLKTLILDNVLQDPSLMKERLCYDVFRAVGIAAPRLSHARLFVNGDYQGIYAVVEPVNKRFVRLNFPENDGNLFDYEWVDYYYFGWLGADPAAYVPIPFKPKTNETSLDASALVAFIATINQSQSLATDIAPYLDLDHFLRYLAVEQVFAEIDGVAGDWGLNNFYVYQQGGGTRFTFIPWDKDVTLMDPARGIYQNVDQNVLTQRLLAHDDVREEFATWAKQIAQSYATVGWLGTRIDAIEAQLSAAVPAADAPDFSSAVDALRAFAQSRAAAVVAELDAKAP
jgi:spore coat protein CotH